MRTTAFLFSGVVLVASAATASPQQLNLPETLCGPPLEVIASVEARGFVNEPIFNVVVPQHIAGRRDYALLPYTLRPEKIAAQPTGGGYVTQRIIWILRTDREPGRPQGWACIYNENVVDERDREDALERGRDIQELMSRDH